MTTYEILQEIINDVNDAKIVFIGSTKSEIYDELGYDAAVVGDIECDTAYLMLEERKLDGDPDAIAWDGTTYMLYKIEE